MKFDAAHLMQSSPSNLENRSNFHIHHTFKKRFFVISIEIFLFSLSKLVEVLAICGFRIHITAISFLRLQNNFGCLNLSMKSFLKLVQTFKMAWKTIFWRTASNDLGQQFRGRWEIRISVVLQKNSSFLELKRRKVEQPPTILQIKIETLEILQRPRRSHPRLRFNLLGSMVWPCLKGTHKGTAECWYVDAIVKALLPFYHLYFINRYSSQNRLHVNIFNLIRR